MIKRYTIVRDSAASHNFCGTLLTIERMDWPTAVRLVLLVAMSAMQEI